MKNFKPISTSIKQTIAIGDDVIICEDYSQFQGIWNVYLVRNDAIVWYAELPLDDDVYSGKMEIVEGELVLSSWRGFAVWADLNTGKILRIIFSK